MIDPSEGAASVPVKIIPTTLHVENLSYDYAPDSVHSIGDGILKSLLPHKWRTTFLGSGERFKAKNIHNVSFRCQAGEITGIVGDEKSVRKTIIDLLCGHRKYGRFSGEIYASVDKSQKTCFESDNKFIAHRSILW